MGDRANIFLTDSSDGTGHGIYLYTHWRGERWPELLAEALTFGNGRWGDNSYLARIITSRVFSTLVDSETGGGISLVLNDNEHPIICVDLQAQEVGFTTEGMERKREGWLAVQSFEEFIKDPKYGIE